MIEAYVLCESGLESDKIVLKHIGIYSERFITQQSLALLTELFRARAETFEEATKLAIRSLALTYKSSPFLETLLACMLPALRLQVERELADAQ